MDRSKLEYLTRQAIERAIAYQASYKYRKEPVDPTVYSDECHGYQVGFYIYYDYEAKDFRVTASARNQQGVGVSSGQDCLQKLNMSPDFVSSLVDKYIDLMKSVDVATQNLDDRYIWWEEETGLGRCRHEEPIPFKCFVTDELYQALDIEREEMKQTVLRLVGYCRDNRDQYIKMHVLFWHRVVCVLTQVDGYVIGFRIRYDAAVGGGFCPICKSDDGEYWQKETCSYRYMPDSDEFIENLTDYYVYLLAMQRGLIVWDNPSEKFTERDIASIIGLFGPERIVFI